MNPSMYTTFDTSDRPLPEIDVDAPPIVQALRIGVTAPSAHNTQPWRIRVTSDRDATLYFDPERSLPHTDPSGRQVHISHGTLLEMTAIGATSIRHRAEFDILPEGDMTFAEVGTKPTAHIRLVAEPQIARDPLFDRIAHRRSSRRDHEGPRVSEAEWRAIADQAARDGVEVGHIPDDRFSAALAIIEKAMAVKVNDRELFGETLKWFRFTPEEIADKGDGLNFYTSGLAELPLLLAKWFSGRENWHAPMIQRPYLSNFDRAARSTRGLLTLKTPTNTMADWIDTGRAYVRAQLAADALGLRFQPVSQVLQEFPQMDVLRAEMDGLVGVARPAKLQMLVRVGRCRPPALSPRRELDSILH